MKTTPEGFVYLEVTNEFEKLASFLNEKNIIPPPHINNIGPHISAILEGEVEDLIFEEGKIFSFSPLRVCKVELYKGESKYPEWHNVHFAWFLEVSCPELESFRSQHGIIPKIENHQFHITFAVQEY